MRKFPRPKIVVSKCLGFEAVRYDGGIIHSDFVEQLKPHVDFIPICPEIEMGLKTPREPLHIISSKGNLRLIQSSSGKDITSKMATVVNKFLDSAYEIDGFILKSKSPSCALRDATVFRKGEGEPIPGEWPGLFGFGAMDSYQYAAFEDEIRLKKKKIREEFLIQIFSFASLREATELKSPKLLGKFHSQNEMLLTARYPEAFDILKLLLMSCDGKLTPLQSIEYRAYFITVLKRPPNREVVLSMVESALSRVSKKLSQADRRDFLNAIKSYKTKKNSLCEALNIMHNHIHKSRDNYLMSQTFFEPFPFDLI